MKPLFVDPAAGSLLEAVGAILAQDIVTVGESGRVRLNKGHLIDPADLDALRAYGGSLHLVRMEEGDVHEDQAARRLATAIAGEGIMMKGPTESQVHLHAAYKGLVTVNPGLLLDLNRIPDVSIFTVFDEQPVIGGRPIGAAKITPLAIPGGAIEYAERLCRERGPVISVSPFRPRSVGVIVRSRLTGASERKFQAAIDRKLGWFGAEVMGVDYVEDDAAMIAEHLQETLDGGAELVLAAGVNSTDPLDLTLQALDRIGARTEKRGMPAHPGSTCWLAYKEDVPIFGLALCGMFARTTVLDVLMCRFFAGSSLIAEDLAHLGYGGLFTKEMAFRFPDYGAADGEG